MMAVEVYVHDRILKPVKEVFAAVVGPEQMARYFISKGSGPLKAGTTVEWEFADVGAKVQINVLQVDQNRRIVYEDSHGGATRTTIEFESDTPESTVVAIAEATFSMDEAGVKRAMGQTAGWTYFLACLKAYLQFGIKLRTGLKTSLTSA